MSTSILVTPRDGGYDVTMDGRTFHVKQDSPLFKIAEELTRLHNLHPDTKFPLYSLAQLEKVAADGLASDEVMQEIARRKGLPYEPPKDRYLK